MINYIENGIHTIELYLRSMSYDKTQAVVDDLYQYQKASDKNVIRKERQGKHGINRRYFVYDGIFPEGIALRIDQVNPMGGIRFIVNPSTLDTQEYDPLALYTPSNKSHLIKNAFGTVEREFTDSKHYGLFEHRPWYFDKKDLSLSRIDLTWNLHFDEETDLAEVIRLFHHADIEKYQQESFDDKEKDKHSFTIRKGSVTFTVYDKNYETKKHKKIDTDYTDIILRIEIKIEREGFKSCFSLTEKPKDYTFDELLMYAYKNRNKILDKYLDKLFPNEGEHLPYQKADAKIKTEADPQYQEAMRHLIKETSRLKNYTRAKEDTMKKFKLGREKIEYLLNEFDRINLSPITLKKDAKTKSIPCFKTMDF